MEIEEAAVKLPVEEQKQLLNFLLRAIPVNKADLSEPRISRENFRALDLEPEG